MNKKFFNIIFIIHQILSIKSLTGIARQYIIYVVRQSLANIFVFSDFDGIKRGDFNGLF